MAHRSIIKCDTCGAEGDTDDGPYPDGWLLLGVTEYNRAKQGVNGAKQKSDYDLCPTCTGKWKQFWSGLLTKGG